MCELSFNGLPKSVIGQSPAERGRRKRKTDGRTDSEDS